MAFDAFDACAINILIFVDLGNVCRWLLFIVDAEFAECAEHYKRLVSLSVSLFTRYRVHYNIYSSACVQTVHVSEIANSDPCKN